MDIIGFDAKRLTHNNTGLGSYARTLIKGLQNENNGQFFFNLYTPSYGNKDLVNQVDIDNYTKFCYPNTNNLISKKLWRTKTINKDLIRDKVKIYHGLSGELPLKISQTNIKTIVTIHDLIFFPHPEFYNNIDTRIYRYKFFHTINQADKIVAISQTTKNDIIRYGNVNSDKIEVIYQGCNNRFLTIVTNEQKEHIRQKYSLPNEFILNVGTIEKRKNILLGVQALEYLPDIELVIIGGHTAYTQTIIDYAIKHNIDKRVHILGHIGVEDLSIIYKMAKIFVYPSIYEGFGIPIIEAIQCGLPVIAAKGSCLQEAGGEDNLYISPYSIKEMIDSVNTLWYNEELRCNIVAKSRQYVQKFENKSIAKDYLELYKQIIS